MSYQCAVCEQLFADIPDDAVEIAGGRGRSRRPATYLFADGNFHYLRKKPGKKQAPSESLSPEPKEDTELLREVASVLAALPTPPTPDTTITQQPLPQIEPVIEEGESLTPMQLAFRRIQER